MIPRVFAVLASIIVLGIVILAAFRWDRDDRERRAMRHNNLGVALMEDRRFEEAIRELEKSLRLNPVYTTARYNFGLTEYLGGAHGRNLDAARTHLERVLELDAEHVSAHYVLGLIDLVKCDWENVEARFYKVHTKRPEDLQTLLHLGKCQLDNGRPEEATLTLSKARGLAPRNWKLAYNLSHALRRTAGDSPLARELLASVKVPFRFVPDGLRNQTPPDPQAQPLPESRISREPSEARPVHVDVTAEVGLDFVRAGARSEEVKRILAGEPTPREWFEDRDHRAQLVAVASASCALLDVDDDDRLDVFIVNADGDHGLFQQASEGRFVRIAAGAGTQGRPAIGTACAAADMDDDGLPDLVVAGWGDIRLYWNSGESFTDITDRLSAPPLSGWSGSWPTGAAWADVEHDGDLDILVTRGVDLSRPKPVTEVRFPRDFPRQRSLLFRNNGNGTFSEVGQEALPPETTSGLRGAFFSDVDGDIAVDLVTLDLGGRVAVSRNRRDGTFSAAQDLAAPPFEATPLGEARAHGDFDRDGSPDRLVTRSGAPAALLRNATVLANWLTVRLEGYTEPGQKTVNRRGIGSKADVRSVGLWRIRELRAGNITGGTDAPELYFDLREEKELDFVRGTFTSGARATQRSVESNQVVVIKEPLWDRW